MSESIGFELQFFLSSIIWGIIILVIYDIIRIFRRVVPHNNFGQAIEDIIFWIISGILIFRMMYIRNNGIIRGFSILGMTLGMIVYNRSLSNLFVKYVSLLLQKLFDLMKKVFLFCMRPMGWLLKRVKWFLGFVYKKVIKIGNKQRKVLKNTQKTFKITFKKK